MKEIPKHLRKPYKAICSIMKKCKGKENALTNKQIQNIVAAKSGHYLYEQEVRFLIHNIRVSKDVKNLLACNTGYYVSKNKDEIKAYKNSLLKRAHMIFIVANTYGN